MLPNAPLRRMASRLRSGGGSARENGAINCEDHYLDLARGIKLSQAAYEWRINKSPPAIVEARFVEPFSDDAIKIYSRAELEASQPSTAMDVRPAVPELNPQRARRA